MLKREDFSRQRIDFLIEEARKHGRFEILSHEEREENRTRFLKNLKPNSDLWVFGYGSLIWNPAFHYVEKRPARLHGFHRSFCLRLTIGRGSPEHPGLMLALDRGGSTNGVAFRIAAEKVESETEILWMREMLTGAYNAHWGNLITNDDVVQGLTFVINRAHSRYAGQPSLDETAEHLLNGKGYLGTCREYLENTVQHLDEIDVRDNYLHRLQHLVQQKESQTG
ncbi:MAG: gamma-glutamylcyclotransferase [Proteobacteria bacterium]|nr:gamma-glutamylcyclotransferase [Pseudomonadota bacterium]